LDQFVEHWKKPSKGLVLCFAGSDAHGLDDFGDDDESVAVRASVCGAADGIDDGFSDVIGGDDFDLFLRMEKEVLLRSDETAACTAPLALTMRVAKRGRESAGVREGFTTRPHLRLDDGFDFFHGFCRLLSGRVAPDFMTSA
jgi:hypothetical protein